MTDHIVTGATGFVGRHLLAGLLADGTTGTVRALARGDARADPAQRVHRALDEAGHSRPQVLDRLTVVPAELAEPMCGVVPDAAAGSAATRVFWHLAASLQWRRGQRERVFRTNVEGTRHALELAEAMGADLFVYTSTAYTCGTLHGDIPEALHRPTGFSNVYEESKCAAEHLVSAYTGVRTLILRPSIVVGTSYDYQPSGSYTGLYGFLSELRRFKEMLGDSGDTVRLSADRNTRLSYVPVDHVVEDALTVVRAELEQPHQEIHHLSGASVCAVGETIDYMLDLLGLQGRLRLVDRTVEDASTLERFFAKRVDFFSEYLRREKRFLRRVGPERSVQMGELTKFIDAEHAV
jgi:nucleoside-diphosphate-sugar epimerase